MWLFGLLVIRVILFPKVIRSSRCYDMGFAASTRLWAFAFLDRVGMVHAYLAY